MINKLIQWFRRNACKECNYYHPKNNVCQSKKCATLRRINYENMGEIDAEQFSEDMNEILDLATKVLEQQPCEDAIRRADAEALFRNARSKLNPSDYKTADEFNTRDLMLLNAEQFIHLLPSVRPQEPKTGHWIKVTNGRGGHECDLCHKYAPSYQSGKEYLTNYCPNCGAKMIEPQRSEE